MMQALRKIYDSAPDEVPVPVPQNGAIAALRSFFRDLIKGGNPDATALYRIVKVRQRVIVNRDALHGRGTSKARKEPDGCS